MIIDSIVVQMLLALTGGVAAELLHWYALSRRPGVVPKYKKKPLYWGTTVGMIVLGGAMPVLYIQDSASALLCFHLGAATPVIVQKLVANLPMLATEQGAGDTSISDFFRW